MAVIYTPHFSVFFDNNGVPLAGGKLYTYAAGTTTPKATYTTAAGNIANSNPITLDAYGRAILFISGAYKFVLKDANDVAIPNGTTDNIIAYTTVDQNSSPFYQSFSGNASQTTFTLSADLGTDEKSIFVFVGGVILAPTAFTLNSTSIVFTAAPASGTNNIQIYAPSLLVGAAAASAAAADISATNAAASAASAAASSAVNLQGTSTTSLAIGTGSKVFTTQAGMAFTVGRFVLVVSAANPANYMHGQITAYSSTSLTVNVTNTGGTGTLNDWNITVSGTQGAQGAAGNITNIASQPSATIAANDIVIFADVSDSNNSKRDTVQGILNLVPAGVLEKVSTTTFAGAADFIVALAAGYIYEIEFLDLNPISGNVEFCFQTSSNNGVSYDSGAANYRYAFQNVGTDNTQTQTSSSGNTVAILTWGGVKSDSLGGISGLAKIRNHDSITRHKKVMFEYDMMKNSGIEVNGFGYATRQSATAVTNIKFFFGSGSSIGSGTAVVYRKAK
jgi:hypothetical protein